jgi:hypothetical protein
MFCTGISVVPLGFSYRQAAVLLWLICITIITSPPYSYPPIHYPPRPTRVLKGSYAARPKWICFTYVPTYSPHSIHLSSSGLNVFRTSIWMAQYLHSTPATLGSKASIVFPTLLLFVCLFVWHPGRREISNPGRGYPFFKTRALLLWILLGADPRTCLVVKMARFCTTESNGFCTTESNGLRCTMYSLSTEIVTKTTISYSL